MLQELKSTVRRFMHGKDGSGGIVICAKATAPAVEERSSWHSELKR